MGDTPPPPGPHRAPLPGRVTPGPTGAQGRVTFAPGSCLHGDAFARGQVAFAPGSCLHRDGSRLHQGRVCTGTGLICTRGPFAPASPLHRDGVRLHEAPRCTRDTLARRRVCTGTGRVYTGVRARGRGRGRPGCVCRGLGPVCTTAAFAQGRLCSGAAVAACPPRVPPPVSRAVLGAAGARRCPWCCPAGAASRPQRAPFGGVGGEVGGGGGTR